MEKLNIAEILKDCPKGTKLYSPLCGECELHMIDNDTITCSFSKNLYHISFDIYGHYNVPAYKNSECLLFPSKENRDWSTFQRPFKDGDVLIGKSGEPFIFKRLNNNEGCYSYCGIDSVGRFKLESDDWTFANSLRFATEEEKQKLFDAIKENGYKWNPETKTLEELIEPKFKVGDRIKYRNGETVYRVVHITEDSYVLDNLCSIPISIEYMYNLVPNKFDITTLKPFESRVLVRSSNDDIWKPAIWGIYNDIYCSAYPYITTYGATRQCIPYEDNQHLLGTTNDCDDYYKTWE